MATKDNYTKSLRFSVETDTKLGKLALKYGYSKFQFFNQMVEYFHRTKKILPTSMMNCSSEP